MVLLNAAVNALIPPAWASLMVWFSRLGGERMAGRRLVRAGQWTSSAVGCTVGAAMVGRPWGVLAGSVNLAIGLVLLGREAGRRTRHG